MRNNEEASDKLSEEEQEMEEEEMGKEMTQEEIDALVKAAVARNGKIIQQLSPPPVMVNMKNYIQEELNKHPCPEHGTTPKIKLKYKSISAGEHCCEAQLKVIRDYLAKVAEDSRNY